MKRKFSFVIIAAVCFLVGMLVGQIQSWNLDSPGDFYPGGNLYAQEGSIEDPAAPTFLHGLNLKVRSANEQNFTNKTLKFGVEVFRDENNDNIIYISETGSIAVVKGKR